MASGPVYNGPAASGRRACVAQAGPGSCLPPGRNNQMASMERQRPRRNWSDLLGLPRSQARTSAAGLLGRRGAGARGHCPGASTFLEG
ncbi:hypothetical protein [Frankia casuarinae]|uniref:hypothetical protein n=1 Tax=Frankia casuarinae (strain DSM 45818 / CECT 9043 / HFP020203 / CcI3) TaxID=106370 RepID=UPI0011D0500F|nr:hypothetical protein [Frankia casuarinae]